MKPLTYRPRTKFTRHAVWFWRQWWRVLLVSPALLSGCIASVDERRGECVRRLGYAQTAVESTAVWSSQPLNHSKYNYPTCFELLRSGTGPR